jgi:hypothetical protein
MTADPSYRVPANASQVVWDDVNWTTPHPTMSDTTEPFDPEPVEAIDP